VEIEKIIKELIQLRTSKNRNGDDNKREGEEMVNTEN
jgi:hypothetical protein